MATDFAIEELEANPLTDVGLRRAIAAEGERLRALAQQIRAQAPDSRQHQSAATILEYAGDLITDYVVDGTFAAKSDHDA